MDEIRRYYEFWSWRFGIEGKFGVEKWSGSGCESYGDHRILKRLSKHNWEVGFRGRGEF